VLSETIQAIVNYRLSQAHECIDSAIREKNARAYKSVANRSYYCIFHAMRAVLVVERFDSKKHSGIISAFTHRYIKTGAFPKEFSKIISDAFDVRGDSDYEDFYAIQKDEIIKQIGNATVFLSAVETYIRTL